VKKRTGRRGSGRISLREDAGSITRLQWLAVRGSPACAGDTIRSNRGQPPGAMFRRKTGARSGVRSATGTSGPSSARQWCERLPAIRLLRAEDAEERRYRPRWSTFASGTPARSLRLLAS
jgi:hypothetical protein